MGPFFNSIIDNTMAVGLRVVELPLFLLIPAAGGFFLLLTLWYRRRSSRGGGRALNVIRFVFLAAVVALFLDLKVVRLVNEVRDLRTRTETNISGLLDLLQVKRNRPLLQLEEIEQILAPHFSGLKLLELVYSEYADVIFMRSEDPLACVFLAVVDLAYPGLEIVLDEKIGDKWLTSDFAREHGCSLAVNGEAGRSPKLDSGFGKYIGNLICRGKPVLLEDSHKRPFLSFDRDNLARYYPQKVVDREVSEEKFNTIWGRADILVEGRVPPNVNRRQWGRLRMPGNAMGIDRSGRRLFLLIADGRQPGYSLGLSLAEMGGILKAFGAYDAMACDAGGSACIFADTFGGIVNYPCDGEERPTYTHFGIRAAD